MEPHEVLLRWCSDTTDEALMPLLTGVWIHRNTGKIWLCAHCEAVILV